MCCICYTCILCTNLQFIIISLTNLQDFHTEFCKLLNFGVKHCPYIINFHYTYSYLLIFPLCFHKKISILKFEN